MDHGCDVCHNFRPQANLRERTLTRVSFGNHVVTLCETHRRIAERSGVNTFEGLREFYGEPNGRRSYVPRRTRDASMRPDGERRQKHGRRATDV